MTIVAASGPLQRLWLHRLCRRYPGWWWMRGSRYGVHGRLREDNVHTSKKLEEILVELKFVATPELEILYSCSFCLTLRSRLK